MTNLALHTGRHLQRSPEIWEVLFSSAKQDENLTDYQKAENNVPRSHENDRQFPLETVMLQSHSLKHDADLKKATVHTGPAANELARSYHALAVTIASNIYFRDGAFKPESEEGRKTLAHELEHVAQYEEGRITHAPDREVLEREARITEAQEEHEDDPLQEVEIGGKTFLLRPSEHHEVVAGAVEMTKNWLKEQKFILEEKEYIRLLLKYEKLKKRGVYYA
jgi:hypothetical protein